MRMERGVQQGRATGYVRCGMSLPTLLNHLAMPGCSKIETHWDRCGVHYINPIDGRER